MSKQAEADNDGVLQPGSRLGQYQIECELGGGGMGRVYRAKNLTLDRIVALKTLAPQLRNDQLLVQRFQMEARAAARLNHPNIVQIYDFGKVDDTYYLAMEFVEGDSLATLLKRAPFAEADAVTITRLACRALAVAHAEGLVHRDIKPDNLMLTSKGELKLVDLGVAKRIGQPEEHSLTNTGQALGTPHYISPEQIRADKTIDGRADLYSLGATLYHLVTGKTPFRGTTSAMVMSMHLYQPFDDPRALVPTLSEGLGQILRKMMAKDPGDRYADADAADRDLYALEVGEPLEAAQAHFGSAATMSDRCPVPAGHYDQPPVKPKTDPHASNAMVTPARNSGIQATTGLGADPNLKILETELAKHVGPLARVLVKRAAKSATSLHQLIVQLEQEIAGDKPRKAFRMAVEKLR